MKISKLLKCEKQYIYIYIDIQVTIESRFTLKRVCDMIRTLQLKQKVENIVTEVKI